MSNKFWVKSTTIKLTWQCDVNREPVETCQPWSQSTTQQVDLAFNIFFLIYFFIRVRLCNTIEWLPLCTTLFVPRIVCWLMQLLFWVSFVWCHWHKRDVEASKTPHTLVLAAAVARVVHSVLVLVMRMRRLVMRWWGWKQAACRCGPGYKPRHLPSFVLHQHLPGTSRWRDRASSRSPQQRE